MQNCRIIRSATRGRSVGFFPLEIQVSRLSSYTVYRQGEVRSLSSWYRLWHSILSTSTCELSVYEANDLELCRRLLPCDRYPLVLTPCRSVFICVASQGPGKTRRFASVFQRRAFTNWTNWSTWHVASYVEATSRGSCALATAWSFHHSGL